MAATTSTPLLSVVVSVYKEEGNITPFLTRIVPLLETLSPDFEIIFALDPCPDRTEEIILEHRALDPRVKLLKFSRRFGQPMATLAGLQYASGQAVIVMDVDLQDPPDLIPQMVAKWREGFDVVYAQRRNRDGETLIKKVVSAVGYKIINRIAEVEIPPNTGDFRLMSRRVVDEINKLKEVHGFLRGLVALVGFKQTSILFDRPARYSGAGNYNRFLGSLRIGLNGMICFSSALLSISTLAGFTLISLSLLWALLVAVVLLAGGCLPLGLSVIAFLITLCGGIQLVAIGILGEYLSRIYDEVKQRPKFIVDQKYGW